MSRAKVFISHVHQDGKWRDRLISHLSILVVRDLIDICDDRSIPAGADWHKTISQQLAEARIAVLLLSSDFLGSDFIQNRQIPQLLDQHERSGMTIYPLLVRPCAWAADPWLARMQLRPLNARPMPESSRGCDKILTDVALEIADIVRGQVSAQRVLSIQKDLEETQCQLDEHKSALDTLAEQIRHYQLSEKRDRAETSLNVDLDVEVISCGSGDSGRYVLETRVSVSNNGDQSACLPAIYVSARALVDRDALASGAARFYNNDVDALPSCGELSAPRNIARVENSIVQLAPGETAHFVRWDTFGVPFTLEYPVIVVVVEVFGAPYGQLGFGTVPRPFKGPSRGAWLDYMNGKDRKDTRRHEKIVFKRASVALAAPDNIEIGDRVLVDPATDEIDLDATHKFWDILLGIFQWSRQKTIPLDKYLAPKDALRVKD